MLSLLQRGHPIVTARCRSHPIGDLAVTVITLEEQVSGWYTMLRKAKQPKELTLAYQSLIDCVRFLASLPILPFPAEVIERFNFLLGLKLNVRRMDVRIAATVIEQGGVLVSRNLRDFRRVPGLVVEDWSV
jgi:tRNA(fMet)-specific endonuclease VapC